MANPFVHIELNTVDLKKAEKFYKTLFGWKLSPMPAVNYTMIDVGAGVGGGMQKTPMPDAPSSWLPYVQVDSVKETIAKAGKGGAKVLIDHMSIGEMGAIGVFVDPTGATLGVWEKGATPAAEPPPASSARKASAKKASPRKAQAKKASAKKAAPKKASGGKAAAPAKKMSAPAPAKKAAAPAKKAKK